MRSRLRFETRPPLHTGDPIVVAAQAAVHGYTTAFWWAAAIFVVGAVVCGVLLRSGAPRVEPHAEPVFAH